MRKTIFIFIGLMFTMKIFSQAYHPIPTDSVFWVESHQAPYMGGTCIETRYDFIYPANQIVINGQTYTEYRAHSLNLYSYFGPPPSTCPFSSSTYPDHLYAFIRNDSINKKVWLYDTATTHTDILLYNFDITTGDTLPLLNAMAYGCPNDTFTVGNIDSVNIGGAFRKRFEIHNVNLLWSPLYLIEGIGSNYGFAYNEYCPFEVVSDLECYHFKNYQYGNVSSSYCTPSLNIPEDEKDPLSIIHPLGPGQFEISNPDNQIVHILCYDMMGKIILDNVYHETEIIHLSGASTGVYVMQINLDNQKVKPYRFIIQR